MNTRQLDIFLDDAEAGMVLAGALLDGQGGTLLPKGAVLTDSALQSLRRRGVERLSIVDARISTEELAKQKEYAEQRLATLFRRTSGQAGSDSLRHAIWRYRTGETA